MRNRLLFLLLIPIFFLSCKKDNDQNPPSTSSISGCTGKAFYFQMIHSELGQVNTSQVHPGNVFMSVAPNENNAEDLNLFFILIKNEEIYMLSAEIKQGNQPGTYEWGSNIGEMSFAYGEHVDKVEEFSITIEMLDNLVQCAENSGLCYKKVKGHYTGILYNMDTEGTSKITGEFCINN